jgi:hypothetical protein
MTKDEEILYLRNLVKNLELKIVDMNEDFKDKKINLKLKLI